MTLDPTPLARHRACFLSGKTRSLDWRIAQLTALQAMLHERAEQFYEALWKDLRRNRVDADLADVKFVAAEAAYARKHLRRWLRPLRIRTPLIVAPAHAQARFEPLGVGLIIGAWNYPVMLCLAPLVAAIAGGNAAVIKPSELSPATAELIARTLPQYLDNEAFSVVLGGAPETTALLELEWDHIFYTGGAAVGRIVMAAASRNLTPVVLELGGKSPTVVHSSANLPVAARRIAYGRWANAGQTCTAPDYVLACRDVAEPLRRLLQEAALAFYGPQPQASPDYGRIVNDRHFDRLLRLLASGDIYHGGQHDRADRYIAPTILVNVPRDAPIMQEEIFGPILPVLEVDSVEEVMAHVNAQPHPLGLYVFAEDGAVVEHILSATRSGDAVVNDCMLQPLVRELPFGGVGHSGMGKYHGEWGFRAYTNARGILYHSTRLDLAVRYPPYSEHQWLRGWVSRLAL